MFRWCTALQQKQWIMTLAGQYKDNKNESYCVTCSHLLSYHVWWNTRLLSLLWTLGPWNLKLLLQNCCISLYTTLITSWRSRLCLKSWCNVLESNWFWMTHLYFQTALIFFEYRTHLKPFGLVILRHPLQTINSKLFLAIITVINQLPSQ